ncbi:MAG: NIPSNAP family protein [Acidobacteriota bacterium]
MDRRAFVSAALAAGGAFLPAAALAAQGAGSGAGRPSDTAPTYYELRRYRLRRGPGQQVVDAYLREAALPAWQRAGAGPIGVFSLMIGPESPTFFAVIPHKDMAAVASLPGKLAADADYQKAGAAYLNAAATEPAFVRIESSVARAFDAMPHPELPFGEGEAGRRPRIFELRMYESHSEKAAKKKIEMFNTAEIAIFRRAGMHPVFFGETIVGPNMPNLTYMLAYEDMAAHDRQWSAFSADPEWKKLSTTPGFTDPEIVSNITNSYWRPTAYSQI